MSTKISRFERGQVFFGGGGGGGGSRHVISLCTSVPVISWTFLVASLRLQYFDPYLTLPMIKYNTRCGGFHKATFYCFFFKLSVYKCKHFNNSVSSDFSGIGNELPPSIYELLL